MKFLDKVSRNIQMSNFIELLPVGKEFFHAERRTDRHDEAKSNSRFPQCCNSAHKLFSPLVYNTTITNEGRGKWGSTYISYLWSSGFVSPRGYRPPLQVFPRYYNQAMIQKSTIISNTSFKICYPSTVLSYKPPLYLSILFCIINMYW